MGEKYPKKKLRDPAALIIKVFVDLQFLIAYLFIILIGRLGHGCGRRLHGNDDGSCGSYPCSGFFLGGYCNDSGGDRGSLCTAVDSYIHLKHFALFDVYLIAGLHVYPCHITVEHVLRIICLLFILYALLVEELKVISLIKSCMVGTIAVPGPILMERTQSAPFS